MIRKKNTILLAFVLVLVLGFHAVAGAADIRQEETQAKTSDFECSGTIWIAGDSIAADHSYEDEALYARFVHGWGEMLGDYLTEDAQIINKAISGETAKNFTVTGNYADIMKGIGKGDFLLVQFGHNDYKSAGPDHSTLPTSEEGSYKWYLKNYYIDPALKVGAMPVLCTSVVLCSFNSNTVSENQAQEKFVNAMKELYEEYCAQGIEIGLIDTYAVTQALLNANSSGAQDYYALKYDKWPDENGNRTTSLDHVHFSEEGARAAADIIAQNLFVKYADFNRFNKRGLVDGGSGTAEDPYQVGTWAQIYQIFQDDKRNNADTYYKLTENLMPVISHIDWETHFYANLDGNGHMMQNPVNLSQEHMFDSNYGILKNIRLEYNMRYEAEDIQTLFVKNNYGIIEDCKANGTVYLSHYSFHEGSDEWKCGVFAADNLQNAIICNCVNRADVTMETDMATAMLGGVAAYNAGMIENCENRGRLELGTSEYVPMNAPVHKEVISCCGGITAVTADMDRLSSVKGTTAVKVHSALKYEAGIITGDAVVTLDDKQLRQILDEQKEPFVPSENPSASDIPDTSEQPVCVKGDIDGDGVLSLFDVQLALKCSLKLIKNEQLDIAAGDLNGNGMLELEEVQHLLRVVLKLERLV